MKNPFLDNFRPYIPDAAKLRELTPLPLIVGTLLGIIFGASSLYLVLKTGLTVSASIPVAVIAITVFRLLSKIGMRDATILEANMMQTAGSAGESIQSDQVQFCLIRLPGHAYPGPGKAIARRGRQT